MSKSKKAFTLVELLVVISIIALLLSILMPSLQKARMQAKRVVCSSHLKQQGISMASYAADFGKYPHSVYQRWESGNLVGSHWPFGGMGHLPIGESDTEDNWEPAGQGALLAAGYIKDPKFFYCPSVNPADFLSYQEMFENERNGYQKDYLETGNIKDINWKYLYINYAYWVGYRTGKPHEDKNLESSVADSPMSRSDDVLATDIIAVNGSQFTFGEFNQSHKYPHPFSCHISGGELEGGSVLHNDGSVRWEDFYKMKTNWGSKSPLKYDRLRFVYNDAFGGRMLWWF